MPQPGFEDLAKDLFFIKKIKDETVANMEILADGFIDATGSMDTFFDKIHTILNKLPIEERFILLEFINRHGQAMVLFTKMICGIEEVLNE